MASNADQVSAWNGELGQSWVERQDRYEDMLRPFLAPLLDAAGIGPGEAVLDIGCGCGTTTLAAAERAGTVLGLDVSEPMLAVARARARTLPRDNAGFEVADAQVHRLPAGAFDVVLSRFGVMFFADPVAAFNNLAAAVRPAGRLAFVCWQARERNEQRMVPLAAITSVVPMAADAPVPPAFSFADAKRVRSVLSDSGWVDVGVAALHEPLRLGADAADAADFMLNQPATRALLAGVEEATAAAAGAALRQALAGHETPAGVVLGSAAWLVTATHP